MIKAISKISTNNRIKYHVYYASGIKKDFTEKDNLPDTVTKVLLFGKCVSTRYNKDFSGNITKCEMFQ